MLRKRGFNGAVSKTPRPRLKGRSRSEVICELLVLLRHGEQFDPDRLYGLASGHSAEPLSFAPILRYPLRDRPR